VKLFKPKTKEHMNCSDVAKVLQSYLDGEVSAETASKVALHLDACNGCGLECSKFQQIKDSMGRFRRELDPSAVTRIEDFISRLESDTDD